jgi:hypothetical protein
MSIDGGQILHKDGGLEALGDKFEDCFDLFPSHVEPTSSSLTYWCQCMGQLRYFVAASWMGAAVVEKLAATWCSKPCSQM